MTMSYHEYQVDNHDLRNLPVNLTSLQGLSSLEKLDGHNSSYIIHPNDSELDEYRDTYTAKWNDIRDGNSPSPTVPNTCTSTRSSLNPGAPAPTPVTVNGEAEHEPAEPAKLAPVSSPKRKNRAQTLPSSDSESSFFLYNNDLPQFDERELDHRLRCLARENVNTLSSGDGPEEQSTFKFDIFEERQHGHEHELRFNGLGLGFLPDDNYLWNENRRASRLCDRVTCGRLKRNFDSQTNANAIGDGYEFGLANLHIQYPHRYDYLSFSASASAIMSHFGHGERGTRSYRPPSLYSARRGPTEMYGSSATSIPTYRPETVTASMSIGVSISDHLSE